MEDPSTGDVQVLLTSKESPVSIRNLAVSWPSLPQVCQRIEAHDLTCCIALSCLAVQKILPSFSGFQYMHLYSLVVPSVFLLYTYKALLSVLVPKARTGVSV
jgi:hypothetical protein